MPDEVEFVRLRQAGFNGLECGKCVEKRVLKQYKQMKEYQGN